MRVLTARGLGDLVVDEAERPSIGPGQVLIETKVTAVSAGTERRMLFGRPGDVREHAPDFPLVGAFGYLAAGDVVEVGEGVDHVKPGDRVSAGRAWGAHREFLDTAAGSVIPIPDEMSYLEGAAAYWAVPPLAGIFAARPRLYDDAAVIGLGPLGLAAVQMLLPSARRVLAVDIVPSRVQEAADYGAVAVAAGDVASAVGEEMPAGPEVVIEASGTQQGLEMALDIARPLGRVALVGVPPPLQGIDLFWPMQHKGIQLVPLHRESTSSPQGGGSGSPRQTYLPDVLDMITQCSLDIAGMMSWVVPMELGPEAFGLLNEHPDRLLGIGFSWSPEHSSHHDRYAALAAQTTDG